MLWDAKGLDEVSWGLVRHVAHMAFIENFCTPAYKFYTSKSEDIELR